jgi:hypothetical protein
LGPCCTFPFPLEHTPTMRCRKRTAPYPRWRTHLPAQQLVQGVMKQRLQLVKVNHSATRDRAAGVGIGVDHAAARAMPVAHVMWGAVVHVNGTGRAHAGLLHAGHVVGVPSLQGVAAVVYHHRVLHRHGCRGRPAAAGGAAPAARGAAVPCSELMTWGAVWKRTCSVHVSWTHAALASPCNRHANAVGAPPGPCSLPHQPTAKYVRYKVSTAVLTSIQL